MDLGAKKVFKLRYYSSFHKSLPNGMRQKLLEKIIGDEKSSEGILLKVRQAHRSRCSSHGMKGHANKPICRLNYLINGTPK